MIRKKIAAANWKMNKNYDEALSLAESIMKSDRPDDVLTLMAVPFPYLKDVAILAVLYQGVEIVAQNCHPEPSGAYTGEVSIPMLKSIGIKYALIGHSERREIFGESDEFINDKLLALLEEDMNIILCCGEPLAVRKEKKQNEYVINQLMICLANLDPDQMSKITIAYEPIWAIGTGETATPEQAQEMHAVIREYLSEIFNSDIAEASSILYGGSVKAANANDLFSQKDVDGGLVGGASLNSDEFLKIIGSFE